MATIMEETTHILSAIGTFCGGVAALIKVLVDIMRGRTGNRKSSISTSIAGVLFLILSAFLFFSLTPDGNGKPYNTQLISQLWQAYNNKDFQKAILKAEECILEFKPAADKKQRELTEQGAPLPRIGKPLTEEEKQVILARDLLNDVATSFYIIGRSKENLGLIKDAKLAYQQASHYTYARIWDPNGWFWSPAESSSKRVSQLNTE